MQREEERDPEPGLERDLVKTFLQQRLWLEMPYLRRRLMRTLDAASRRELDRALRGTNVRHAREVANRLGVELEEALHEIIRPSAEASARKRRHGVAMNSSKPSSIIHPPRLIGSWLLRWLLRPADYKRIVEPQIADMHEEYFACLATGDERGARWAIIRGNLYAVPSWVWTFIVRVLSRIIHWTRI